LRDDAIDCRRIAALGAEVVVTDPHLRPDPIPSSLHAKAAA
jgi:hypothetical protein